MRSFEHPRRDPDATLITRPEVEPYSLLNELRGMHDQPEEFMVRLEEDWEFGEEAVQLFFKRGCLIEDESLFTELMRIPLVEGHPLGRYFLSKGLSFEQPDSMRATDDAHLVFLRCAAAASFATFESVLEHRSARTVIKQCRISSFAPQPLGGYADEYLRQNGLRLLDALEIEVGYLPPEYVAELAVIQLAVQLLRQLHPELGPTFENALVGGRTRLTNKAASRLLQNVRELSKEEGRLERLHRDYGICHFHRYEAEQLAHMAERHTDEARPYGVIIVADADWNGAFDGLGHALAPLAAHPSGIELKLYECADLLRMARALVTVTNRMAGAGPAKYAVLCGHGSADGVLLGSRSETRIDAGAVIGLKRASYEKLIDQNGSIALISCSTGGDEAIAGVIARSAGVPTTGPDIQTNIKHLTLDVVDGSFLLDASYWNNANACTSQP